MKFVLKLILLYLLILVFPGCKKDNDENENSATAEKLKVSNNNELDKSKKIYFTSDAKGNITDRHTFKGNEVFELKTGKGSDNNFHQAGYYYDSIHKKTDIYIYSYLKLPINDISYCKPSDIYGPQIFNDYNIIITGNCQGYDLDVATGSSSTSNVNNEIAIDVTTSKDSVEIIAYSIENKSYKRFFTKSGTINFDNIQSQTLKLTNINFPYVPQKKIAYMYVNYWDSTDMTRHLNYSPFDDNRYFSFPDFGKEFNYFSYTFYAEDMLGGNWICMGNIIPDTLNMLNPVYTIEKSDYPNFTLNMTDDQCEYYSVMYQYDSENTSVTWYLYIPNNLKTFILPDVNKINEENNLNIDLSKIKLYSIQFIKNSKKNSYSRMLKNSIQQAFRPSFFEKIDYWTYSKTMKQ